MCTTYVCTQQNRVTQLASSYRHELFYKDENSWEQIHCVLSKEGWLAFTNTLAVPSVNSFGTHRNAVHRLWITCFAEMCFHVAHCECAMHMQASAYCSILLLIVAQARSVAYCSVQNNGPAFQKLRFQPDETFLSWSSSIHKNNRGQTSKLMWNIFHSF